ncbi:MAG TPA: bacterioferritin [Acidimicrobiia bacterium]|jgi:bacterioferritin|nr:bacterioferritin [Acidimicrobiia bacterium]
MQSTPEIIELLNDVLTAELTAINQYFIHYKMQENWGYQRLASKGKEESFGEMKHAEALIERIIYLEGVPNMQRLGPVKVGETVPEQLKAELQTEVEAIARLAAGVEQCRRTDEGTRLLLEEILSDEEDHADWLETQLSMINDLGEGLYLNAQVHE